MSEPGHPTPPTDATPQTLAEIAGGVSASLPRDAGGPILMGFFFARE